MTRKSIDRTIIANEERIRVIRIIGILILRRLISEMSSRIIQVEKMIINRVGNLNHRNIGIM